MIPEGSFLKLTKAPKLYDVVQITSFQRLQVNGQDLLMLKDPIHIIHDHLTTNIGNPEDFKTVMARNEDSMKG